MATMGLVASYRCDQVLNIKETASENLVLMWYCHDIDIINPGSASPDATCDLDAVAIRL